MKRLKILRSILVRTKSTEILLSYLGFILIDALVILLFEPNITSYGDALWYCYAIISTAGFGDLVAVTLVGRIGSVLLTVYSVIVIAVVTGVIVNFYTQLLQARRKNITEDFTQKLRRLPELSREELEEMARIAREAMDGE